MRGESRAARRAGRGDTPERPWFRLPPSAPHPPDAEPVLVLGAGLAGCHLARALSERGRRVTLIDRAGQAGGGASGNPAGVAKPFVTRAPSAPADFFRAAFAVLLERLGTLPDARFAPCGVLQLSDDPYPPDEAWRVLDRVAATREAGTALPCGGLAFDAAGWLDPGAMCRALVASAPRGDIERAFHADISAIERGADDRWTLRARDGRRFESRTLVLANGPQLATTAWTRTLPIRLARGQISRFALRGAGPRSVVTGRHYAIPDGDTLYVGATFERDDADPRVRATDHGSNLAGLRALLPEIGVHADALSGHAGVRATTPDRLPLVGPSHDEAASRARFADAVRGARAPDGEPWLPLIPGLHVLGGFGSRGIVAAPLCAALLADRLCGGDRLRRWMPLLHPVRFTVRTLRRGPHGSERRQ